MSVKIKLEYYGRYAAKAGLKNEEVSVSENIAATYEHLVKYLKEKYGFEPPFVLMLNNMHIIGAVKENIRLKDGDVFKLLPFMSGG